MSTLQISLTGSTQKSLASLPPHSSLCNPFSPLQPKKLENTESGLITALRNVLQELHTMKHKTTCLSGPEYLSNPVSA